MDTPTTHPTPVDAETISPRRDMVQAVVLGLAVALLVFLSVVGIISLINGSQTLNAVNEQTSATQHTVKGLKTLNENAAQFFHEIGPLVANLEQNQYVTCLAVHAIGCAKPG